MKLVVVFKSEVISWAIWLAIDQVLPASVSTFSAVASGGIAMRTAVGSARCASPAVGTSRSQGAAIAESRMRSAGRIVYPHVGNCPESFDPGRWLALRPLVGRQEGRSHGRVGQ